MTATFLLILLALATLADHISTNVFLKRGMREGNPILAKIIAKWGSTGLFVFKAAMFGVILVAHFKFGPLPTLLLAACVGVFVAVTAWNVYQIAQRS